MSVLPPSQSVRRASVRFNLLENVHPRTLVVLVQWLDVASVPGVAAASETRLGKGSSTLGTSILGVLRRMKVVLIHSHGFVFQLGSVERRDSLSSTSVGGRSDCDKTSNLHSIALAEKKDLVELVIRENGGTPASSASATTSPLTANASSQAGSRTNTANTSSSSSSGLRGRDPVERYRSTFPKNYTESTHRAEWFSKFEGDKKEEDEEVREASFCTYYEH